MLGIEQAILAGYSMGGPIAQLTWRRHADRVAGLVLCATTTHFGEASRNAFNLAFTGGLTGAATAIRTMPLPLRRQLAHASMGLRRQALGMPDWVLDETRHNDPAALLDAVRALRRFDARPWIGEVDVPTGVVVTTLDRVVPPRRQRRMAEAIPGAATFEAEGDHAVCVMNPRRFIPPLLAACSFVASGGSVVQRSG